MGGVREEEGKGEVRRRSGRSEGGGSRGRGCVQHVGLFMWQHASSP